MLSSISTLLRKFSRVQTIMVFVVVVAVVAYAITRQFRGQAVEVVEVKSAPLIQSVVVSGRMANESRVFLGATITGRVAEVRYREGAMVKAGEWVIKLEDAELSASARQAIAAVKNAEARLESQRRLIGPIAQQQFEQARTNANTAEKERERNESLFQKGFIGQSRLDEARRASDVARSQLKSAEAQAEANQRGAELEAAVTRVAEARAAADLAQARLAQTRILAPADGLILDRTVEPGQIVQAGTRLIGISISGRQQLIAQVDEKFLAQLKVGQRAIVTADAFPREPFNAVILSIAPTIDAQRGSVELKFSLDQPPVFLRNDMTLSIDVETARRDKALALPGDVVRANSTVQVIDNGRAVTRTVRLGIRTLSAVEVISGMTEGDLVIKDAGVADGTRVHVERKHPKDESHSNVSTDAMKSITRE
jgi:HlyD family secretion protein